MKLCPQVRSKLWHRGRNDSATSSGPRMGMAFAPARTFETRLPWVSITPFGSPVVPEV